MNELKKCPFCKDGQIYKIQRENELGTIIPQLFCNSCKMIFEVENDSPYLHDGKTYDYLEEKLHKTFNTRKPMERILERLEERIDSKEDERERARIDNPLRYEMCDSYIGAMNYAIEIIEEELNQ